MPLSEIQPGCWAQAARRLRALGFGVAVLAPVAAGSTPAFAQGYGFFAPFRYSYNYHPLPPRPVPEIALPLPLPPSEVPRLLARSGFSGVRHIVMRDEIYVARASAPDGAPVSVRIDAYDGEILSVYPAPGEMRRDAPPPPPASTLKLQKPKTVTAPLPQPRPSTQASAQTVLPGASTSGIPTPATEYPPAMPKLLQTAPATPPALPPVQGLE